MAVTCEPEGLGPVMMYVILQAKRLSLALTQCYVVINCADSQSSLLNASTVSAHPIIA